MKRSLIAVAAATTLLALVVAPNDSSANAAASAPKAQLQVTGDEVNMSETPAVRPDENHTPIGGICKGYIAWCRFDRECCRPYLCLRDRRRGGFSCL